MSVPLELRAHLPQAGSSQPASPAPSPRLVNAAHEFEAAMMKELLTPLTPGHDLVGGDDEEGSSNALSEYAGEALGKALSERGGFGIAKRVLAQLASAGNHSGKSPVTGNNRTTASISPSK